MNINEMHKVAGNLAMATSRMSRLPTRITSFFNRMRRSPSSFKATLAATEKANALGLPTTRPLDVGMVNQGRGVLSEGNLRQMLGPHSDDAFFAAQNLQLPKTPLSVVVRQNPNLPPGVLDRMKLMEDRLGIAPWGYYGSSGIRSGGLKNLTADGRKMLEKTYARTALENMPTNMGEQLVQRELKQPVGGW